MLRKHFVKLASIMLVLVCMFSFATPAFAAYGVKDDPYGYTYLDESNRNDVWYFQYYSKAGGRAYSAVDYAYLIGNTLYDKDGDDCGFDGWPAASMAREKFLAAVKRLGLRQS